MEQAKIEVLVIEMQMGSRTAFDQLCRYFHVGLLRFSYKICRNEQMAHDAVQNSWLKLGKSIQSLKDPRAFKSWLYQLARWQTLDLLRKAQKDLLNFSDEEVDNTADSQPITPIEQVSSTLLNAIEKLSAIDRQAVYLFYLEDMTVAEISTVLEVAQGTVKSRLNRARNDLKQQLSH